MDHLELLYGKGAFVPGTPCNGATARLVVVSNRVPAPAAVKEPSAGGLAIALSAALKARGGLWFGWSGETCKEGEIAARVSTSKDITFAVCGLSRFQVEEYYHNFANRALWPICHYRLDLANISESSAAAYFRVNELFAGQLCKLVRPDDLVWIHDYHFIPMASYLRALGFTNRIGFFLHIPWPGPEVASALPAYPRLLRAFGAYDLIGFQTETDAANFRKCLASAGKDWRAGRAWCETASRPFHIRAFPVGIDTADFARKSRLAENDPAVKRMRASFNGHDFIIGVDRLDYSKGLKQRLEAFDAFLGRSPWAARARIFMLQIAPKSRSEVPEYALLQRELAGEAGRINGKHGDVDWIPLRYINKSLSQKVLAGLYRMARVGLVTPLRDGMNLVAKEYAAAQAPENPGVLILSQFAGAAQELTSALIVNPYDIEATVGAIERAFAMPLGERKERWSSMMAALRANSVHGWADRFLHALANDAGAYEFDILPGEPPPLSPDYALSGDAAAGPALGQRRSTLKKVGICGRPLIEGLPALTKP